MAVVSVKMVSGWIPDKMSLKLASDESSGVFNRILQLLDTFLLHS